MKYLSICSGIEAASVAFEPLGWRPLAFSEIEAFPRAVLQHHYPDTPLHGDFTVLKDEPWIVDADMLCGGTPCFVAGHMVLTAAGYRPIEDVRAGDMVMTHAGRLRRVIRHGTKSATVGTLRGVGLSEGIVCTEDHPFLSVQHRMQNTRRDGVYAKIEHTGAPEWIAAKDMPGRQWCALLNYEAMPHGPRSTKFDTRTCMYLAGFYLGDGWVRSHGAAKKKSVLFGINRAKYEVLRPWLGNVAHTVTNEPTSVRVAIHDTALAIWLMTEFGSGAHNKHIPAWVMGHQHRRELMRGYLDTDGSRSGDHYTVNSVSRSLAFGASDLLNAEGFVASVAKVETDDTTVIDGRTVNQSDYYSVRAFLRSKSRKSRERHGLLLRKVTGYEPGIMRDTVYNIEVEEDNSYILDGAIVHNCQAFSVAGNRQSLADDRGNLTLQFVLLADAIDHLRSTAGREPAWILWENVPGVLSTNDNAFGAFLGGLVGRTAPIPEPADGWTGAGVVDGPTRVAAWRVLDAQHFGLAQRRKRVFVLARGGASKWAAADALLPIIESREWHPAPGRKKGEEIAADAGAGAEGCVDAIPINTQLGLRGDTSNTSREGIGVGNPGDPAFTLQAAHGHAVAFAQPPILIRMREGKEGGGKGPLVSKDQSLTLATANDQVLCVSAPNNTFEHKGIKHACPQEAYSGEILRTLREEIGEEAFVQWGFGIIASLQQEEVLRAWLHGDGLRREATARRDTSKLIKAPFKEGCSGWPMRELWEHGPDGCTPQGRRLVEQLCDELEAAVPQLSHAGTLTDEEMHGMRKAAEGIGVLRQALSEVQEVGRPEQGGLAEAGGVLDAGLRHNKSRPRTMQQARTADAQGNIEPRTDEQVRSSESTLVQTFSVRRLLPEECEALQGFPRNYTRIPWKGRTADQCPDGPRYKALGNSWAVPVVGWIGERIKAIRP